MKVVVLNSGGFDSVCLINHLKNNLEPDMELHTLFFDYGQNNASMERSCARKVAMKTSSTFTEVKIPKISWTNSNFYGKDFIDPQSQYLEYRNLIFLSYALSFCESIKAERIYMALLKHLNFKDTSELFLEKFNSLSESLERVSVLTPFSNFEKYDLSPIAFLHGITPSDYFSCDTPKFNRPCGECPDCLLLKEMEEDFLPNNPFKVWVKTFDPRNRDFIKSVKGFPIREMRVLINNDCQLKCEHCFYGFDGMKAPKLSKEEMFEVIEQAGELGIENIHFSGKEPLFDDDILWYAQKMQERVPHMTFDLVTNGINVSKYVHALKEYGCKKIFLSVDDILDSGMFRKVHGVTDKALNSLNEAGMPCEVFIDLHINNYNKVRDIINFLHEKYSVNLFYVRTISNIGRARDIEPLKLKELEEVFKQLCLIDFGEVFLSIGTPHVYPFFEGQFDDYHIARALENSIKLGINEVTDNFTFLPEAFCTKYISQITLTPDGYVLGCGSEMSSKDYDKISAGNVKDHSLSSIIKRGKSICLCSNESQVDKDGNILFFTCPHENPIDTKHNVW